VLTPERLAELVDRVMARAASGPTLDERRTTVERQLRDARARVTRYVQAIGDGLDVAEVRAELTASKAKVQALELELASLDAPALPALERNAIARRIADWRAILHRGPVLARQVLRNIFPGARPIVLRPVEGDGVAFTGNATGASILAGLANVTMVVPPG